MDRTARRRASEAAITMTLVLALVLAWGVLSLLGLVGVAAVCRSGHLEDVARGFTEPASEPLPAVVLPQPSPAGDDRQVTPR